MRALFEKYAFATLCVALHSFTVIGQTPGTDSLKDALSVLDAKTATRERILISQVLIENARAFLTLGANGEFVVLPSLTSNPGDNSAVTFLVVSDGEEFRVVAAAEINELGMHFGDTFARISASGKIQYVQATKLTEVLPLIPVYWPSEKSKSGLEFPSRYTIFSSNSEREDKNLTKIPEGVVEWLIPEFTGHLLSPPDGVHRPENVLWVFEDKGGFRLEHSGPLQTGLYAQVQPDGRFLYGNGAPKHLRDSDKEYWWPYIQNGRVVLIPRGIQGRVFTSDTIRAVWNDDEYVGLRHGGRRVIRAPMEKSD